MITQTSEYALRTVAYLATVDNQIARRSDIAESVQVSVAYLTKVLRDLEAAGIVQVKRGPNGGYSLLKSPDALSVYDVVSAVEQLQRIQKCPLGIVGHQKLCPLHDSLDHAAALVEQHFKGTTIAELLPKRISTKGCKFPRQS